MLSHKEWQKINEIILIINSTKSLDLMREYFLDALKLLVPYDKGMFYLVNDSPLIEMKRPIMVNVDFLFFKKYIECIDNSANGRIAMNLRRTVSYRDTDFSDNRKQVNDVYLKLLLPNKLEYGGGIIIASDHKLLAELTIYRYKQRGNYTDKELLVLDILKEHLRIRFTNAVSEQDSVDVFLANSNLTRREIEVVNYLLQDNNNEQIAKTLNISVHTAKKHVSNIYTKLNINNRIQLLKLLNQKL